MAENKRLTPYDIRSNLDSVVFELRDGKPLERALFYISTTADPELRNIQSAELWRLANDEMESMQKILGLLTVNSLALDSIKKLITVEDVLPFARLYKEEAIKIDRNTGNLKITERGKKYLETIRGE